jgi:hypothetical protein
MVRIGQPPSRITPSGVHVTFPVIDLIFRQIYAFFTIELDCGELFTLASRLPDLRLGGATTSEATYG